MFMMVQRIKSCLSIFLCLKSVQLEMILKEMQHVDVLLSLSNICKFSLNCQHGARPAEWKVQRSKISFMLIFIQYPYSYFHQYFNYLKKRTFMYRCSLWIVNTLHHHLNEACKVVKSLSYIFLANTNSFDFTGHNHCICFKIFSLVTIYSLISNFWKYVDLWRNIIFNIF